MSLFTYKISGLENCKWLVYKETIGEDTTRFLIFSGSKRGEVTEFETHPAYNVKGTEDHAFIKNLTPLADGDSVDFDFDTVKGSVTNVKVLITLKRLLEGVAITTPKYDPYERFVAEAFERKNFTGLVGGSKALFYPFTVKKGRKYLKAVAGNGVHSFVDKNTGDIYKPASYNAPAKHARGNINSAYGLSPDGYVNYLR